MPLVYILMVSAVVPSMMLLWYFRARDVFPEPAKVLRATFGLGVLTVIPVLIVALPIQSAISTVESPVLLGFLKAFLTAAGPEELFKYLVVLFYCSRHKEFDEPMDGVVYGATASLGFATLENVLYVSTGGIGVAVMRALLAVPGHAFMGAIMGYFIGQSKFRPHEKTKFLALGYFVPFLLHGLYDWPLLSMKEGSSAASHADAVPAALLLVTLVTFVFEWVWTVRITRRLRAEQLAFSQQNPTPIAAAPAPPFAHGPFANPYTVAPHWAPMPPARTSSPVIGALSIVVGVVLSAFGGMIALGCLLAIFMPETGVTRSNVGSLIVAVVLIGVLPLALGIGAFVFGIKKLNGS